MSNVGRHMQTISDWFLRKTRGPTGSLREVARATEEWKRSTGRLHYAQITLVAYPAQSFEFVSPEAAWSSEEVRSEFEHDVLDGVVSELLANPGPPTLGIRIVVEATVSHEFDSNGNAFYQASKRATAKLLEGSTGQFRGNCT
jgi:hypothetical protein